MEGKYEQVYPERAIAPLRNIVHRLLSDNGTRLRPEIVGDCNEALADLEELGFPPDEPLFLLRGQDELAPDVVREYIRAVDREEEAFVGDRLGVTNRLYELVNLMERWQPRKMPD